MADIEVAGVTFPDSNEVDILTSFEAVQDYCGWHIAPVLTETITVDSENGHTLHLPTLRLVDLVSVKVDGEDVTESLRFSKHGMVEWKSPCRRFPRGFGRIEVTMRHGFEKMPAGVSAVVSSRAANAGGGPKQIMAGPFLIINGNEDMDGINGYSDSALVALERYRIKART